MSTADLIPAGNPFANVNIATVSDSRSVMESAIMSKELAEAQAKIYLAKQFPRNPVQCWEAVMNSCRRPGLAMSAIYRYPRGTNADGTQNFVTGPSIRLAEEIARGWKNIETGWMELERSANTAKIKAFAWDQESNISKSLIFSIKLMRFTKKGSYPITDERDIYELCANQAARRMRNCILALIPGDIVEDAINECYKTINAKANVTPDRVRAMVEEFKKLGVIREQIEKKIGRKVEQITPAQFIDFTTIFTSIRDRIADVDQYFEPVATVNDEPVKIQNSESKKPIEDVKEKIQKAVAPKRTQKPKPKPDPDPEPEQEEEQKEDKTESNEIPEEQKEEEETDQEIVSLALEFSGMIANASDKNTLDSIRGNVIRKLNTGELTENEAQSLINYIKDRYPFASRS